MEWRLQESNSTLVFIWRNPIVNTWFDFNAHSWILYSVCLWVPIILLAVIVFNTHPCTVWYTSILVWDITVNTDDLKISFYTWKILTEEKKKKNANQTNQKLYPPWRSRNVEVFAYWIIPSQQIASDVEAGNIQSNPSDRKQLIRQVYPSWNLIYIPPGYTSEKPGLNENWLTGDLDFFLAGLKGL